MTGPHDMDENDPQRLRDERDEMRRDGVKHAPGFDPEATRSVTEADADETERASMPETD